LTYPGLVIFDCDGVLVDSEPISCRVLSANLVRHGLIKSPAECEDLFVGGSMRGVQSYVRSLGIDLPGDWIDEIYAETYSALKNGVDIVSGVPDVLDILTRQGVPFCVASNGSDEKMGITLGQNGLLERFRDAMFSAQTLGVSKPDPELFLHASKAMGVTPDRCVVVEDSLNGVTAAKRAGMRCFGYVAEGDGASLRDAGAEVFGDMAELPGLLGLD